MAATISLTVLTTDDGDPFNPAVTNGLNTNRAKVRRFARMLLAIAGSQKKRVTLRIGTAFGSATATLVAAVAGNSVSINGKAVAASQLKARATVTAAGTEVAGDTVVVNGKVLTAAVAASSDITLAQFTLGAAGVTAANLTALINALNAAGLLPGIDATVAAAVVKLRAQKDGVAGNAFTLVQTGAHFVVSGATFTLGAAAVGDQWDPGDTDAQSATNLALAINGSAQALINANVTASSVAGVVTVTSLDKGLGGNSNQLTRVGAPITLAGAPTGLLTGGTDLVVQM